MSRTVEMTLTAFTSLSTTIPKSGETVNFSVGSALMGKVILSATSAVTDSTGRCYITIKSASGFPYEQGIIFAKWTPSWDTSAHLTSQITITLASLPLTDIPPPIEISLVSPSNPLTYSDDSLPYISNYTSQSRYDWFMAGKISFTIVGLLSQISWSPVSIPPEDSAWGQMVDLQFPLGKVIWFNENHLDPNPFTNGFHGVAASQRHNLRQVANHELGHALGLGHIGSLPSIMFPAPQGFFFSGNQTPQAFDKSVLSGVYPQPQ